MRVWIAGSTRESPTPGWKPTLSRRAVRGGPCRPAYGVSRASGSAGYARTARPVRPGTLWTLERGTIMAGMDTALTVSRHQVVTGYGLGLVAVPRSDRERACPMASPATTTT